MLLEATPTKSVTQLENKCLNNLAGTYEQDTDIVFF